MYIFFEKIIVLDYDPLNKIKTHKSTSICTIE